MAVEWRGQKHSDLSVEQSKNKTLGVMRASLLDWTELPAQKNYKASFRLAHRPQVASDAQSVPKWSLI